MPTKNDHSALLDQLEQGIADLSSSDRWRHHLAFQSRFHRYSFGNTVLIAAQDPDATRVAGFHTWRSLDRVVAKGEKAIWILAPMIGPRAATEVADEERRIHGFKYVAVFDIRQTIGDDPPVVCTRLSGDDPTGFYARLVTVAGALGFTVEDHRFGPSTNGDCSPSERRIRIEFSNTPAQRVKTLAHELAHAVLHDRVDDRPLAELEAESTAYVVCRTAGIDTGEYSFGYVACWAGGGGQAIAQIKASCGRIQRAASLIVESLPSVDARAA